jgi:hypothetical protein
MTPRQRENLKSCIHGTVCLITISVILAFLIDKAWGQGLPGQESVLTEDSYPSYWHDARTGPLSGGNAWEQSWRGGGTFGLDEGAHCYIETDEGVAGFRKSGNSWILFLSIVSPPHLYRPHYIQPDAFERPYAGMVAPLTNPVLPPPPLCLSAFGCS